EPITLLPRIGLGNALRLAVLGRHCRITAEEALRISLVDEVVEPARLLDRAIELAEQAGSGSPAAIEASKRAIRGALERPMAEAMQDGWELLLAHRQHPDSHEGPLAFAEKRAARWL
ncbi:MAG TPA: enoyl-CoA hydratase-related protein, partial [Acidimicrobiia bacterium]|nr:enoyl-CoA hydratase-related protein [Acidimicrobiia bacterium]